ncbi:MAG: hypothetical protein ABI330_02225 [Caldimonas sp.]|nr:hypothetical protein [Pseudomonadota bacterium]MDQ2927107.1 hypothetical protein [Pseudomonadota bacterium]
MRRLVWLLAIWVGWQVFKEAQREYADTESTVADGLAPLSPFPADR